MRPQDYHYFVARNATNTSVSYTGYTDKASGVLMQVFKGRKEKIDGERVDVPHRWKFDHAHRTIRVHKNDKSLLPTVVYDDDGNEKTIFIKSVDFLRNHPACKDSPNGSGSDMEWEFSELKEHEDAVTAVDAKKTQLKALNAAMNLDKAELKEMAALYGMFDPDDAKQKHFLLEKAGAEPSEFLNLFESPERSAKALLKKAVSLGIVKTKGTLHVWEKETLGADEDLAISKLMSDKDYAEGLRNAVKGIRK
jgi:hypothetical protein